MLLYPLSFTYRPRNGLEEREVRTNKIDRINQLLRTVSLVNWVVSKNVENQMEGVNGREIADAGERALLRQLRTGSALSQIDQD